jgi:hypothetical protein
MIIEALSDEFKELLNTMLASFCYGSVQVEEDAEYYSLRRTIVEFFLRYDAKAAETQLGMAGELAIHLLMPEAHVNLRSIAVFFNKEERSIKKGFDLTFQASDDLSIWYGEVKSGSVKPGETPNEKMEALLKTASADLKGKLGPHATRSRWDSAIIDAGLTLESAQAATAKKLLRSDHESLRSSDQITKRAVLAATVMHPCDQCCVSGEKVAEVASAIQRGGTFSALRVLVVQQSEVETVVTYLRTLGSDA